MEMEDKCNDHMIKELINYIQNEAKHYRTGIRFMQLRQMSQGQFKRPKVWSNTRMFVYKWEMLERFLQNAKYFDIPSRFIILAQLYGLVMYALKIVLKNVQRTNLEHTYVQAVIVGDVGLKAMVLGSSVAVALQNDDSTDTLLTNPDIIEETNICIHSEKTFCLELQEYLQKNGELFRKPDAFDRVTRSDAFTAVDAKKVADRYSEQLWKGIKKRLKFTDLSNSPCSYSEAPAEGIFSVLSRVSNGRESATIEHLVALTRIAVHGPPASTEASAKLAEEAMKHFTSQYGERFCSKLWCPGKTSSTISTLKAKEWNW